MHPKKSVNVQIGRHGTNSNQLASVPELWLPFTVGMIS